MIATAVSTANIIATTAGNTKSPITPKPKMVAARLTLRRMDGGQVDILISYWNSPTFSGNNAGAFVISTP